MESIETQIAEWRAYVAKVPAVNGHDVDELEDHLRHQIAELGTAGLTEDEAFLVAVKRMGDLDAVSREYAREHSGRLWKQLLELRREDAGPCRRLARRPRLRGSRGGRDPGRPPRGGIPGRRADLVRAEPRAVRVAVPRRVLRAPATAGRPRLDLGCGAVCARRGGRQRLSVRRGLRHRGPGRPPPPGRVVVRGRVRLHGRDDPIARTAHGLRALHRRVVHLLRADRARRRGAHGVDRGDPPADGRRRRPDRRVR